MNSTLSVFMQSFSSCLSTSWTVSTHWYLSILDRTFFIFNH